ncbi:cell adhesion molecule Dscam1 isoform X2 [Euwallacea similis]|uniref:cell adhesion molecule Dscam1 isoform X2 n=2 Tax=Euwallacea similis TaxID=1736056 RepID=UPI00344F21DB
MERWKTTILLNALFRLISEFGVKAQNHGPVYLLEPPAQLTFSNTTGSQVSCSAHGSPSPQVEWLLHDGNTVTAVPGLRQSLGNGTLYFPPFRAEDYRADVHSTIYRCRASNIAGTILSREVHVQAVVSEQYEVNVYHSHVIAGNTAVLTCVIPPVVKEHVTVTSWSRDESILLPGPNMGGRIVVTYGTGELLIRSVRHDDSLPTYSCLTIHALTQERKRSQAARLTVIESTRNVPPRLNPTSSSFDAYKETDIHLTCTAQGNPPPNFGWYRDVKGYLQPVLASPRLEPSQDILLLKRLTPEDSGRWTCKVFNSFGEQRLDVHLNVIAHLSVHVLPQLQVINSGENALFNCTVSGTPIGRVRWVKNGLPIAFDRNEKLKLLDPLVLQIAGVTRHDKGMYQCMVENEKENAQGSAELRLGDTVPEMQNYFIEQAVQPGVQVSLKCSATGFPPPQFKWLLDGQILTDLKPDYRYAISQYLNDAGDVIAHLNVTSVRVEDGGLYTCMASNALGIVEHSARLNVYGPPFIRSIGPTKAVAGSDAIIHCPYSGYPIKSVRWERHGQELPQDVRHRLEEGSNPFIRSGKEQIKVFAIAGGALKIMKVDQNTDKGFYTCFVSNKEGHVARKEIQLVVNAPPVMEPFNFPTSIQEGGRAQVTCSVTAGDLPIHFFWYKDEEPISASLEVEEIQAAFYSILVFKNVNSKHTGAYTCVASNSAARVNYTAQLMVKVAPQWTIEPQDISALLGNSVLIQCLAKGFPEPTISWLKGYGKSTDYRPISGIHRVTKLGNGSLWFEAVTSEDEGNYLCRATNGIGSGLGKVIDVSIKEPVRFDTSFKNMSVKRGEEITLICNVHGDAPIELAWIFNDSPLDLHKLRFSHVSLKEEKELKSQLTISRSDREDSGIYKCLAENDFGRSEHVINLTVQEKPDPPSHLEAIEVLGKSVRLSWKRSFDGNTPVVGYVAQYKMLDSHHSTWEKNQILNLSMTSSTHPGEIIEQAVINGLKSATVYTIRVAAVNNIDRSEFTEPIVVKTLEERPSGAPLDVKVDSVSSTELFIQWTPPLRDTWNGELLGYKINWKEHHGPMNHSNVHTVNGWATNKFHLPGLKKFTTYDVTISAFNSIDEGPSSPTIIGTTKEGVPEAPPLDVMCSEISSQIMKISWKIPPPHLHGGLIQGYKVFYKPVENHQSVTDVSSSVGGEVKRTQSTETYLHGLQKFTNHSIKVLAYTSAGDGVASAELFCCTEEDFPGKPASLKASAVTAESILISWLPPVKRNGLIILYTVYCREAGRVGHHKSYNVRIEDINEAIGLIYEVRNLREHQLYEFWEGFFIQVSATTKVGEGESTPIVAQQTASTAPPKVASFSQIIYQPIKSEIVLPCLAVGMPRPNTKWIHEKKPITFGKFYAVTIEGHLHIHDVDVSLTGNYTCKAENVYGKDSITYSLIVLMPPSAPDIEIEYATSNSIKVKWTEPENGGAKIQGYALNIKDEHSDWTRIDILPESQQYTIENLKCGSPHYVYVAAQNGVGRGTFSPIVSIRTKGGPPLLPKEDQIFASNSSVITVILKNWPNGGCPITQFSLEYKSYTESSWLLVAKDVSKEQIVIENLPPGTWYQIKITAQNDAGMVRGFYNVATLTIDGSKVPMLPKMLEEITDFKDDRFWTQKVFIIPASVLLGLTVVVLSCVIVMYQKKRNRKQGRFDSNNGKTETHSARHLRHRHVQDKLAERESSRTNMQQMYLPPPVKGSDKVVENDIADYTMQFKTFSHMEDGDRSRGIISKNQSSKGTWHKNQHYYNNESALLPHPTQILYRPQLHHNEPNADSDSEDTSGSGGCGDTTGTSYRPTKKRERGHSGVGYTGYETLLVADLYRNKDSSTESNELSPLAERRQPAVKRHYRTASSSRSIKY